MAAEPWWREAKQAWYVTLGGKQVRLAKDKAEAFKRWHTLLAGVAKHPQPECDVTVSKLYAAYLEDHKNHVTPATHRTAVAFLKAFVEHFGKASSGRLQRVDVEKFLQRQSAWAASSKHEAGIRVIALFNWAVRCGMLPKNPLAGLRKPRAVSRGTSALIDAATHEKLLQAAPPYLQDVLRVLHDTGCRPGELCAVTAAAFDPGLCCWLLASHKTAHTTGKPRVIWLTAAASDICRRLAAKHPTGPLFRTPRNLPWDACYLARNFRNLRKRLNLPDTLTLYGYRHTFATDALANGVPDAHVAELLGHCGTVMLHKHYSHLLPRNAALKAALAKVRQKGGDAA